MSPVQKHRAALGLTLLGAALVAPATAAATVPSPVPAQAELVSRATGTAGAVQLGPDYGQQARPGAITNDGRGVIFEAVPNGPQGETPVLAPGLYQRDLVTGRTKLIAGGDAHFAGFDGSQHWTAFTTSQSLSPQDTNGITDLYATLDGGAPVLLSKSGSSALGVKSSTFGEPANAILTRDAKWAIFENNGTIYRRNLTTSRTAKLPQRGTFGQIQSSAPATSFASADGQVYAVGGLVITKSRLIDLTGPDGPPVVGPLISSAGDRAVAQLYGSRLDSIRFVNTITGDVTRPTLPPELTNPPGEFDSEQGNLLRVSRDGRTAIVVDYTLEENASGSLDTNERLKSWNLETGVVTDLELPYALLSETLHFGTIFSGGSSVIAMAAAGYTLPGTIDLPSPNAYVSLNEECNYRADGSFGRISLVKSKFRTLPKITSLKVEAFTPAGATLVSATLPPATGFTNSPSVAIPSGTGAYSLKITATFPDGRTTTETSKHIARTC